MIPDAVFGAIVGGLIGSSAAIAVAILNIRQADRHRFSDSKMTRYSEFLRGLDEQRRQIRFQRGEIDRLGRPVSATDAVPDVARHESLKLLAHEIRLMASRDSKVGDAAAEALAALQDLRRYRYDPQRAPAFLHEAESLDGYGPAVDRLTSAMEQFTERARTDLGS